MQIFIDSDSTHNYIYEKLATKIGYPMVDIATIRVGVANGDKFQCAKMCSKFQWMMQMAGFTTDVLVILLNNYDTVLGIQWMLTLDDIIWNFKKLTLRFCIGGVDFELKGTNHNDFAICSAEKMSTILQCSNQLVLA